MERKKRSTEKFERNSWRKLYRIRLKAEGICTSCSSAPAANNTTFCAVCIERKQKYYKKKRDEAYEIIYERYGQVCCCCGESGRKFLSLDHILGGGNLHRKELKTSGGVDFYMKLIRQGLPDGFQTLCYNCNIASYRNGGICPHKEK